MANIKSVKPKSTPKTILHKYTQRQLDTLAQARPILYKSIVAEGYEIVPEPQRVVESRPVAEFATGLSTHNPKVEQKAKKTMTTENTVETPAAPVAKKAAAKKVVKKVVKKTTTTVTTPKAGKKATTKKAAPAKVKAEPKDPNKLSTPQIRILKLLSKSKALTRPQIAEKAPVDSAFCTTYIGSLDDEKRVANDEKRGTKSLLTHKYVKAEQMEGEPVTYSITAAGKSALAKAEKAE